jgi:hypothetical protein
MFFRRRHRSPRLKFVPNSMYGIEVLVEGSNPVVDIVVLHGLDGDPRASFTATIGDMDICWLQHPDMLPMALPHARIAAFGYDVKTKSANLSVATLKDHADGLLQDLMRLRYDTKVCI